MPEAYEHLFVFYCHSEFRKRFGFTGLMHSFLCMNLVNIISLNVNLTQLSKSV